MVYFIKYVLTRPHSSYTWPQLIFGFDCTDPIPVKFTHHFMGSENQLEKKLYQFETRTWIDSDCEISYGDDILEITGYIFFADYENGWRSLEILNNWFYHPRIKQYIDDAKMTYVAQLLNR